MKLTHSEVEVVQTACGSDISKIDGEWSDDWRTFEDVDRVRLVELAEEYAGYVMNNTVDRLPNVGVLREFLTKYPFFRVHGFFHNLNVDTSIEVYFTGIKYVPCKDIPLMSFDEQDFCELKQKFAKLFYKADYIHLEEAEIVADFHFDRLLETEDE